MSNPNEGSTQGEGQQSDNFTPSVDELLAQLDSEKKSKERILEESKKYKEGYQTFKAKQEELEKNKALEEEEKLKKQGQYQVLVDQRDSRIKELEDTLNKTKEEISTRDNAIVNFRKAAAFEKALGGKLRKEAYWGHVEFDKIAINPDNGEIDSHSLKKVADGFIDNYKELVDFGNKANLPNGTPGGSVGRLTHEQWKQLPVNERKKRMKDVVL